LLHVRRRVEQRRSRRRRAGSSGAAPAPALPARPRLRPWYRIAQADGALIFEYGESLLRFEGAAAARLLPALLPLLDGTRTLQEIGQTLGEAIGPAVRNALELLVEHGLVEDGLPAGEQAALFGRAERFLAASSHRRAPESEVAEVLRSARVAVVGDGALAHELLRLLRLSGLGDVVASDWDGAAADLSIAAPSPSDLVRLPAWNRDRLERRQAWLQVLPHNGRYAAVGPLFVPAETSCFECFQLRRAGNSGYEDEFRLLDEVPPAWGGVLPLDCILAGAAALMALRWVVDRDPCLPGQFLSVRPVEGLEVAVHAVYRVPRCPACSTLATTASPLPWGDFA
jgi:bacteriocin biosynthesis cyclodehydratase domain-containing protein